jgi:hypothetical protein
MGLRFDLSSGQRATLKVDPLSDKTQSKPDISRQEMTPGEVLLLGCSVLSLIVSCIVWSARKQEWVDEIYTWTEVNDPSLWHLLYAIQHGADGGMPLFYTTAWIWAKTFGSGALSLRLYSCLAFCGAFVVLWRTVRRAYGVRATAVGLLTVWGTSALILDLNAEARFYGLYTLMVAIAILFYVRLAEQENPGPILLAGAMLSQAGLVLSHILGIIYGALIMLALILFDASRRRFRGVVYLFPVAGWLALLVWVPAIRASIAVGTPRGWIPMPEISDIVASYNFQIWQIPILAIQSRYDEFPIMAMYWSVLIVVAVALIAVFAGLLHASIRPRRPEFDGKLALRIVALSILSISLLLFALSRLVTPLFVRRYTVAGAMGLAIVFVAFADAMGIERIRKIHSAGGFAWIGTVILLMAMPVISAAMVGYPEINSEFLDVPRLDTLVPRNVLVVVQWQHDFFKAMRYSGRADRPYLYLLAWPPVVNGQQEPVSDFKLMRNYRQVGYYSSNIKDQLDFVCTHPYFLVLDNKWSDWSASLKKEFPDLKFDVVADIDEDRQLYAVRRTGSSAACDQVQAGRLADHR